ncbi:hypothetical protein [Aquiflexum lacus]|uniref:hypothetical protein n=1 Tax=Aquiflexum lacus TaxID=2483805 RepID=UPI00189616E8|nr:hypothetical protein [Aquiflexum lacus]
MNRTSYLVISSIILFFSSYEQNIHKYEINGSFNGFSENSKVVISDAGTGEFLDSTRLIGNQFISKGSFNDPPKIDLYSHKFRK